MNISVIVGDRKYGAYETDQYLIYATKNEENGSVTVEFGYGYDSKIPFKDFGDTQGEQYGGSVTIDFDAAKWMAYALLNLCGYFDERKSFTLKFDAKEMEFETIDDIGWME